MQPFTLFGYQYGALFLSSGRDFKLFDDLESRIILLFNIMLEYSSLCLMNDEDDYRQRKPLLVHQLIFSWYLRLGSWPRCVFIIDIISIIHHDEMLAIIILFHVVLNFYFQ